MEISSTPLEKSFSNVSLVGENLFRAEKIHEGSPYEVHYFDSTESLLNDDFDIDAYQYDILSEDFYSASDSNQSSYYLNFVVPDDKLSDFIKSHDVNSILDNRSFARKRVISESQLSYFLSDQPQESETAKAKSPVDEWRNLLEPHNLEFLLDRGISRTRAVEALASGEKISEKSGRSATQEYADPFPALAKLQLVSFRPKPIIRDYSFGKVNLITGPNAVGKTSLLEAIELAICGKTIRNPEAKDKFKFLTSNSISDELQAVTRLTDKDYRSRDRFWYGRHYRAGNELYRSFARFNFFDADAATRFSTDILEGNITEAIEGIVFGYDSKELEKHILAVHTELERLKRKSERDANDLKEKESLLQVQIEAQGTTEAKVEYSDRISSSELKKLGVASERDLTVVELQEELSKLEVESSIVSEQDSVASSTEISSLTSLLSEAKDTNKKLKDSSLREEELEVKRRHLAHELRNVSQKIDHFERLKSYNDKIVTKIKHSEEGLNESTKKIQTARRFISQVDALFENNIPQGNVPITQQVSSLINSLDVLQSEQSKALSERNSLEIDATSTAESIAKIKREALNLLRNTELSHCPACETEHGHSNLILRIESSLASVSFQSKEALTKLDHDISERQKKISKFSSDLEVTQKLVETFQSFGFTLNLSFDEIPEIVDNARAAIARLEQQINDFAETISEHKERGLSLENYRALLREVGAEEYNAEQVNLIVSSLRQHAEAIKQKIGILAESLSGERLNQETLLQNLTSFNADLSQPDDLEVNIYKLEKLINATSTLTQFFILPKSTSLVALSKKIVETQALLLSLLDLRERNLRISQTEKELLQVRREHAAAIETLENIKTPIAVLGDLLETGRLQNMLSDFLSENEQSINKTFLQLHSPQEFTSLTISNGNIQLKRSSGELAEVTNLSTGQRTALALSFFLTLNSSLDSAPKILLFDDPIVYIDDLNILAFLDFLRKFSIQSDRQIFFATANSRLAALFHKKFEFLKDEFTYVTLPREE